MALIYNTVRGIANSIPVLFAKIGSIFLAFYFIGMLSGYWFASIGYTPFVLLIPVAALAVMWQKLDEGVLVLIILMAIAVMFPELFLL